MIGVMTRSNSCSGTCLNFSTARQPKTSALESAEGAGGRSTVEPHAGASVAHALFSGSAFRRRSARRTLLRGSGCPSRNRRARCPRRSSARERLVRVACGVPAMHRQLRALGAALDACAPRRASSSCAASSSRAGSASATCRKPEPVAAFSSRLVPSAIFLPWSMTAMRAASWSASSRYCVVSRIVTPESGERADHAPDALARLRDRGRSSARRGTARPA